MREQEEVI